MSISWGYSPKIEKFIPLGDFPTDRYLIIARQVIENMGWSLSHISERGIIAYTPISFQSYSEEISVRIENNFAVVKSECVGIQMLFNDYGKNELNLNKFFHEFEYVEFHLKDVWEDSLVKFHDFIATQDKDYFEKAPLTAKNKIRNLFYLFYPQRNYFVTPILILMNSVYYIVYTILMIKYLIAVKPSIPQIEDIGYYLGANNRELVLNGQYWRLISHQFVHGSFFHLLFNMYALAYIGLMVEHKMGAKKFALTYLLSGICGGLISIIYHGVGYMAGASGAIMGLFGAFLALLLSKAFEKNATKALTISTLIVLTIMLSNGLMQGVDNAAHFGGLVSGFIVCFILSNAELFRWNLSMSIRYMIVSVLTLVFAIVVLISTPNYQIRKYLELEREYLENAKAFIDIYIIPSDLSRTEKLEMIKTNGVEVWKKNELLVKQMLKLKLPKRQQYRVQFHQKMVKLNAEISTLLYKESVEHSKAYRDKIHLLTMEVNKARAELRENELAE